nr:MAG TPA: hypothetical protein [Caudoviricetes sp.]
MSENLTDTAGVEPSKATADRRGVLKLRNTKWRYYNS